jgi:predicted RNase H-like HicB family nuclease
MEFTVVLEEREKGYVVATCPALPGCYSQGKTQAEALTNMREATIGCVPTWNDRTRRETQKGRCIEVLV